MPRRSPHIYVQNDSRFIKTYYVNQRRELRTENFVWEAGNMYTASTYSFNYKGNYSPQEYHHFEDTRGNIPLGRCTIFSVVYVQLIQSHTLRFRKNIKTKGEIVYTPYATSLPTLLYNVLQSYTLVPYIEKPQISKTRLVYLQRIQNDTANHLFSQCQPKNLVKFLNRFDVRELKYSPICISRKSNLAR